MRLRAQHFPRRCREMNALPVLLALAIALAASMAHGQGLSISPDAIFATVGRCTVENDALRKQLAEAQAKIAELTKPPPAVDPAAKP